MDLQNPLIHLRQLKGAPLSIIVALIVVNQPSQAKWLAAITGYSPNIITSALVLLLEMQLVSCNRSRSAWRLTDRAKQLPLVQALEAPDRINCDPSGTLLTYLNNVPEEEIEGKQAAFNEMDRVNRDPEIEACLNLLQESGIREPTASIICNMDHVDYLYIDAHIKKAAHDNIDTALLIFRMQSADPIPEDFIDKNSERYRRRYIEGDLSDFINH